MKRRKTSKRTHQIGSVKKVTKGMMGLTKDGGPSASGRKFVIWP